MRRMSRWVTGVPLPGWMFSAFMTAHSLPSISSTLPLRTELAITLTTVNRSRICERSEPSSRRGAEDLAQQLAAFYRPFSASPRSIVPLPQSRQPSSWWRPDKHGDRRPFLLARGRIRAALRTWFEAEGFVEVETSALQVSPGNELNLFAFATELVDPDGTRQRLYLHTSPEFACKKLLAAGEERVFTFAQVFRNRERGALHHPAFTMLEWYRAREPYERLMQDCAQVLRIAAEAVGCDALRRGGRRAAPRGAPDPVAASGDLRT